MASDACLVEAEQQEDVATDFLGREGAGAAKDAEGLVELRDDVTAFGGGRGFVARRRILAQELVHESALLAAAPLEGYVNRLCASCSRACMEPLERKCATCQQAFFCSAACEEQGRIEHNRVCAVLALWHRMRCFDAEQVSLLRLLLAVYGRCGQLQKEEATGAGAAAEAAGPEGRPIGGFRGLHWHPRAWDGREREDWSGSLACFEHLLQRASKGSDSSCAVPSREELEADLGRLECNAIAVVAEDKMSIGAAVFPTAAIGFNHNCAPNCSLDSEGPPATLRVFANRDVEAGEDLCISYVDVEEPGPIRRRDLRQQYRFDCRCARCLEELSNGEAGRAARKRRRCFGAEEEDAAEAPVPAEVVDAVRAAEIVERVATRRDTNVAVVRQLVAAPRLLAWAADLCSLGQESADVLYFWEGFKALPGESVRDQFSRQLQEDIDEMAASLGPRPWNRRSQGRVPVADPAALAELQALVLRMLDLYSPPTGERPASDEVGRFSSSRGFCLSLAINDEEGPGGKFHDDWFTLRFELTLAGAGTVVAQNNAVDWEFWDKCDGRLAIPDSLSATALEEHLKAWNSKVCPSTGELAAGLMDLVVMKGGAVASRPCIHRSPDSVALKSGRLLITLDRPTKAEMEKQRDMMDFRSEAEESASDDEG